MKKSPTTFADALVALEKTVEKLERGDLPLEDALTAFESGVGLVRHLEQKLTEVEKRIEVLTRDQAGIFQLEPLTEEDNEQ
ncbi:MAG: exodeoxyribonuclease VII small subunit [Deltaproteobacteria bacterium]|nr:exodeoxyribonuclease VII small subunit [Deltaproteobacteria bacterium]